MENTKPNMSAVSMKKFKMIKKVIEDRCNHEDAEYICQQICAIIKFNPERGLSSQEKVDRTLEWRKKKAEELGVTTAVIQRGIKNLQKK